MTRAVRVIDLITNLDMSAFHSLGGWDKMLARLEMEWKECAHEAPTILPAKVKPALDQRGDGQEEQGTAMYAHFFEVTLVVHAPLPPPSAQVLPIRHIKSVWCLPLLHLL